MTPQEQADELRAIAHSFGARVNVNTADRLFKIADEISPPPPTLLEAARAVLHCRGRHPEQMTAALDGLAAAVGREPGP